MALRLESEASRCGYDLARIANCGNGPERNMACRVSYPGRAFTRSEHLGKRLGYQNKLPEQAPTLINRRIRCSRNPVSPPLTSVSPSLSDHILDCVSSFLLSQGRRLMPESFSSHDALNWLPPKLHEQVHKSEAFATTLVREGLVFSTLGLMYCQVEALCQGLFRIVSATRQAPLFTDGAEYKNSVYHAATDPLRLLIFIWASTRMLRVIASSGQLQHYIQADFFARARSIGVVVSSTWFLFRWKQHIIDKFLTKHKDDEPRVLAYDRLLSLVLYFLATTYIADIVGFALNSLLAVGGISGLAMGLAAKEVASNIFGGVVIFVTRPFLIGEKIKAGAISGQVVDIGYMQTKVLGFDGTPLLVPNQAFINQVITNFSRAKSKQLEASFYIHNQDIFLVNKITKDVVEYLKTHPQVETKLSNPQCYLNTMGQMGPEISILCSINFGEGSFFGVRQEIMVQVAKIICDVLGDESPYFRNSVTNLMWELRMHLLYHAGQGMRNLSLLQCVNSWLISCLDCDPKPEI